MWLWEEDSENGPRSDEDLTSDVRQLRSWFREMRQRDPHVAFGYGRAWTRFSSKAYPLVLLNLWHRYAPFPFFARRGRPLPVDRLLSTEQRRSIGLPETRLTLFGLLVDPPEASTSIRERIESLIPIRNGLWCPKTESLGSAGVSFSVSKTSEQRFRKSIPKM